MTLVSKIKRTNFELVIGWLLYVEKEDSGDSIWDLLSQYVLKQIVGILFFICLPKHRSLARPYLLYNEYVIVIDSQDC